MQHFEVYGRKTGCRLEEDGVVDGQGYPIRTDRIAVSAAATIDWKAVTSQDVANFDMKVA